MTLTTDEWYFIANALRVASEVYAHDADTSRFTISAKLAQTFIDQSKRASNLADRIEASV